MKVFVMIAALAVVTGCSSNGRSGLGVVRTDAGLVSGNNENGVSIYRGIRYAAAPMADLRWKAPADVQPWDGIRDATGFSPICPQPEAAGAPLSTMDEDCLFLNVWTPAERGGEKLPVMVFIHGGAFKTGAGSDVLYEGTSLARKNVVVVTLNYRLGALGFMAHPDLTRESPHNSSGNYGLLDQIAALKWVQHNIGAFGGDPSQVTAFGESAGATGMLAHLVSPLSGGLFGQAIVQSGPLYTTGHVLKVFRPRDEGEQYGVDFAGTLGVSGPDAIRKMRMVAARDLVKAVPVPSPPSGFWLMHDLQFKPIVDGWIIPEAPEQMLRKKPVTIPLIIGSNSHEGIALALGVHRDVTWYRQYLRDEFGSEADQVLARYPAGSSEEVQHQMERITTDFDFANAAKFVAGNSRNAYLYRYSHPTSVAGYASYGTSYGGPFASHGSELAYIFKYSPYMVGESNLKVAETMMDLWTLFAKTGNPNGGIGVTWPKYTTEADQYLDISAVPAVKTGY